MLYYRQISIQNGTFYLKKNHFLINSLFSYVEVKAATSLMVIFEIDGKQMKCYKKVFFTYLTVFNVKNKRVKNCHFFDKIHTLCNNLYSRYLEI